MVDPISVAASIVSILAAAAKVIEIVQPFVSNSKDAPKIAMQVHSEANCVRIILEPLKTLLQDISTPSSSAATHASFIRVDHLIVIFTDGVLLFAELESILGPLDIPNDAQPQLRHRVYWASKKNAISDVLRRVQHFLVSLSALFNVLQCRSDMAAVQSQRVLDSQITALLDTNRTLAARVKDLEDTFNAAATVKGPPRDSSSRIPDSDEVTIHGASLQNNDATNMGPVTPSHSDSNRLSVMSNTSQYSSYSVLRFQEEIENSRVYRRANRANSLLSFSSSVIGSRAWSVFSGLSLAEISAISVIALPLTPSDVENAEHYFFGSLVDLGPQPQEVAMDASSLYYESKKLMHHLSQILGLPDTSPIGRYVNETLALWKIFKTGDIFPTLHSLLSFDSPFSDSFSVKTRANHLNDVYKVRPLIQIMNELICQNAARLHISDLFDERKQMIEDDNKIPGPPAAAEMIRQLMREERVYVNQLERIIKLRIYLGSSEKIREDRNGLFLALDSISRFAAHFLHELETVKSQQNDLGVPLVIAIFSIMTTPFRAYGDYRCCWNAFARSDLIFDIIRDYVKGSPAMKDVGDMVESKAILNTHLNCPNARCNAYLNFLSLVLDESEWTEQQRWSIKTRYTKLRSIVPDALMESDLPGLADPG
ncbi:hypothetical protein BCR34DRAFT_84268 [Clohesyomyces aquaticus]|uniref:DH domain-containing protein n=1 Tax=Clohesyomyces aquaticus TaxID=1231657 RepID=A0A1Y1YW90_9PLEO|nr:hypothetical protein BCR34DRAFT_84268 [Clohesyomyces aquaticus]